MLGSRKRPVRSKRTRPLLTTAGRAGPRRLLLLTVAGASVVGLGAVAMTRGVDAPAISADARRRGVDPLPGGFLSSPEQDAVAFHADTQAADAAMRERRSSTPPLSPSVKLVDGVLPPAPSPDVVSPRALRAPPPRPVVNAAPPPPVYPQAVIIPAVARVTAPPSNPPADPKPQATPVQYNPPRDDGRQRAYEQQMRDLLDQWGSRPPQTDVILLPPDNRGDPGTPAAQPSAPSRAPDLPGIQPVSTRQDLGGQILVPAGRGIYAHPILKLSSDTGGPVVLQADSGLIAGDRLIGSFTQQGNRLVIRIDNVIHHGEPIGGVRIRRLAGHQGGRRRQRRRSEPAEPLHPSRRRRLRAGARQRDRYDQQHHGRPQPARRRDHRDEPEPQSATWRRGRCRCFQHRLHPERRRAQRADRDPGCRCHRRRHVPDQRRHQG